MKDRLLVMESVIGAFAEEHRISIQEARIWILEMGATIVPESVLDGEQALHIGGFEALRPGSVRYQCGGCGCPVFISETFPRDGDLIKCLDCAAAMSDAPASLKRMAARVRRPG